MLDILVYGSPVLRKRAMPVEIFDTALQAFAEEMVATMRVGEGIGLAAPQVGRSIRMVVVDPTLGEQPPIVLINPEILWSSEEKEDYEEGCLSVPDIRLNINRPTMVTVRAQNARGETFTVEKAGGLLARVIQHEMDHLDGILIVDRASVVQRQLIEGKLKKMARSQGSKTKVA